MVFMIIQVFSIGTKLIIIWSGCHPRNINNNEPYRPGHTFYTHGIADPNLHWNVYCPFFEILNT